MNKNRQKMKLQKGDFTKNQIRIGSIYANFSLFLGIISIAILYYCFVSPKYDNVFKYTLIFWTFGLIGALCYILFHYKIISKKIPYLKYLETKGRNTIGAVMFVFVVLPFCILYFNNKFADSKKIFEISARVLNKEKVTRSILKAGYYSSKYNYYLYVDYKGEEKRILIDKAIWDSLDMKSIITLHIQTGYFGFDFINNLTY
jgi:hypothetical protein